MDLFDRLTEAQKDAVSGQARRVLGSLVYRLKCPSCGAPLELAEEVRQFVCGHCGASAILRHEGGSIWAEVEGALRGTHEATGRIAAELALPRLRRELQAVQADIARLSEVMAKPFPPSKEQRKLSDVGSYVASFFFSSGALVREGNRLCRQMEQHTFEMAQRRYESDVVAYQFSSVQVRSLTLPTIFLPIRAQTAAACVT